MCNFKWFSFSSFGLFVELEVKVKIRRLIRTLTGQQLIMDLTGEKVHQARVGLLMQSCLVHGVSSIWNAFTPFLHLIAHQLVHTQSLPLHDLPFWARCPALCSGSILGRLQPQPDSYSIAIFPCLSPLLISEMLEAVPCLTCLCLHRFQPGTSI